MLENYELNEYTLLASILYSDNIRKELVDKVFTYVPKEMFFSNKAKYIYTILKDLLKTDSSLLGCPTQLVQRIGYIANIEYPKQGLISLLMSLEEYWISSATIPNWIKKIQDEYFKEEFKNAKTEKDYKELEKLKARYKFDVDVVSIGYEGENALAEYDKRQDTSIKTSYDSINRIIGSFQGGDMIVLAGASSSGKTCMALNLITGIAKQGKKVLIFSLEMPSYQLQQRIAASELEIDATKFRSFQLTIEERKKFNDFMSNGIKKLPIYIYKKQIASIELIKTVVQNSDADIVFIDYLGLIDSYSNKGSYEKYSDISREIKLLAMSSNKPIVILHQLNRNFNEREDKKPKVSDLRDSGKIEQDADMIFLVYRPAQFGDTSKKEDISLIIGKNRSGKSGTEVNLLFNGMYQQVLERKW